MTLPSEDAAMCTKPRCGEPATHWLVQPGNVYYATCEVHADEIVQLSRRSYRKEKM